MSDTDKYYSLNLPAGVVKNGTRYQSRGRWSDSNLVRWSEGVLRPIGGWTTLKDSGGADLVATGTPRGAHSWRADDGGAWFATGTTGSGVTKAYALLGYGLTDITPAGFPSCLKDATYITAGNYGQGPYGRGPYGQGTAVGQLTDADVWHFDNFGQSLVGLATCDGRPLSWDLNPSNDFVAIADAPTGVRAIVVTPEGFLFALGCSGSPVSNGCQAGQSPGRRRVQWPDQQTLTVWTPTGANQAGGKTLQAKGALMAGRRTTSQTVLFTDEDAHAATYIGLPFVYTFKQVCDNCGLIGPNAVVEMGNVLYWMARKQFYKYDGVVVPIPSEVSDYVFGDMAVAQRHKIVAWAVPEFNEVWWFYPSASSLENDRYVIYNVLENHWAVGKLARNAGVPSGVLAGPVLMSAAGKFYQHESGENRESEIPFVESGPIEVGNGEQFLDMQTLIPDEKTLGDTSASFYVSNFPTEGETLYGPFSLANPTSVRFQARQMRVRFQEARQTSWRIGVPRLGFVPGDRR